ncbi:MAG: hypothetical protein IT178_17100 [Acidobacteria bacterium]|nr:hypothetical protein [Acidobacteriota bacterium]
MSDFPSLTRALEAALRAHAPEWTERNDADPGVTLLEMLAFLAEALQFERGVVPAGTAAAARVKKALEGYETPLIASQEAWSGVTRPRFFAGRLLTAADLDEEQRYHLAAHRRLLRAIYVDAVISGLQVSVAETGDTVTIAPGTAVDAFGREIIVASPATLTIPTGSSSSLWVTVEYAERPIDRVPIANSDAGEATRIEEGGRIGVTAQPAPLTIARLIRDGKGWKKA